MKFSATIWIFYNFQIKKNQFLRKLFAEIRYIVCTYSLENIRQDILVQILSFFETFLKLFRLLLDQFEVLDFPQLFESKMFWNFVIIGFSIPFLRSKTFRTLSSPLSSLSVFITTKGESLWCIFLKKHSNALAEETSFGTLDFVVDKLFSAFKSFLTWSTRIGILFARIVLGGFQLEFVSTVRPWDFLGKEKLRAAQNSCNFYYLIGWRQEDKKIVLLKVFTT